jgi:hypothetical protein
VAVSVNRENTNRSHVQVGQRPAKTWPTIRVAYTFSTSQHMTGLHQIPAEYKYQCVNHGTRMPNVTSATTLPFISWNSPKALEFLESPPCKSKMTCIPSSSLSLSRSHLDVADKCEIYEMWLRNQYSTLDFPGVVTTLQQELHR